MTANELVRHLIASGLTQKEIERRSGVHQSVVSALNTGRYGKRTPYTTMRALELLAEALSQEGQGADAFRGACALCANPYPRDTVAAKHWEQGFLAEKSKAVA